MTMTDPKAFLRSLFETAIDASHPDKCLAGSLPPAPDKGRLIILSIGKAGAAMAAAAERFYRDTQAWNSGRIGGVAVSRHGYRAPLERIALIEAGHPVPDEASISASEAVLSAATLAGEDDFVVVLISGGGSALMTAPVEGVTLSDKQDVTRALLRSGAPIDEINTVRKHLSRIKGGRLQRAITPARSLTLAISDVAGDHTSSIASGPTVPDPTTLHDARAILKTYGIIPPEAVQAALKNPENESVKPGDPAFANAEIQIVASASTAVAAAAKEAEAAGLKAIDLGHHLEDEARVLAKQHARHAIEAAESGTPSLILSGGEAGVVIAGNGRGGPNQEFALALALELEGRENIWALAGDTDGTDGGSGAADDPAGAMIEPDTLRRAQAIGLDAKAMLENNDSTTFFRLIGDLVETGPTNTNVNDFRAILVDACGKRV